MSFKKSGKKNNKRKVQNMDIDLFAQHENEDIHEHFEDVPSDDTDNSFDGISDDFAQDYWQIEPGLHEFKESWFKRLTSLLMLPFSFIGSIFSRFSRKNVSVSKKVNKKAENKANKNKLANKNKKKQNKNKDIKNPITTLWQIWGATVSIIFSLGTAFSIIGYAGYLAVYNNPYYNRQLLLEFTENWQSDEETRIYAYSGNLVAEHAFAKRKSVPLENIPQQIIDAFIATEDVRFYEHSGIDFEGLVKSLLDILAGDPRGGSTITQQLIKTELQTSYEDEDVPTIDRKIIEIILAPQLEERIGKDKVLEQYLNRIPLGRTQIFGVASASLNYFDKDLSELTLSQSAYLAGVPKAPSSYDLRYNLSLSKDRRDVVLGRLYSEGYIRKEDYESAKSESLMSVFRSSKFNVTHAGYFSERIESQLKDLYGSEVIENRDVPNYKRMGLTIFSTLDEGMQEAAYDALRNGLLEYDRSRGGWRGPITNINIFKDGSMIDWNKALSSVIEDKSYQSQIAGIGEWKVAIVLDVQPNEAKLGFADNTASGILLLNSNKSRMRPKLRNGIGSAPNSLQKSLQVGDVIIVSQSIDDSYLIEQIPEISGALIALNPNTGHVLAMQGGFEYDSNVNAFNRAVSAERQPGSSFKPIIYLTAMEKGMTPATNVVDEPVNIWDNDRYWAPKNYGGEYNGRSTLAKALCRSRNIPSVKLGQALTMQSIADMSVKLGLVEFGSKKYNELSKQLSATLGAKEVTPLNMIVAYAQMVNGGRKIIPTFIDRIADRHGEMIYRSDNRICEQCEQEQYQEGQQMPVLPDTRQRVIDEVSAYQVVDMLRCVVTNSGTAPAVGRELDFPIAGKTGTTNDEKDAWFVGFTPDLVTAVYVGFDNPKSLGRGMTGGRVAAPIFIDFMKKINAGKEKVNFRKPEGNTVSLPIDNMGWPVFDGTGKPTIFKTDTEPNSAYGPGNVEDFISAGSYGPANTDYDDPFINENRAPSAISNVTGGIW